MTKTIAILGSTGSIGKTLLKIIKKNESSFKIVLLTANNDHKTLYSQAKKYKVKNLIIKNLICYQILKKNANKQILMFIIILIFSTKFLKKKLITQ